MTVRKAAFLQPYLGLPKSIYVMCASEMASSMGNFVLPFTTLLFTVVLGYSVARAGFLVTMIYLFMYVPGALLGGRLSDRVGRKKTLCAALSGRAACYLYCAYLGPSPQLVVYMAFAIFFLGAAMPCYQSLMMDITRPPNRKAAFSLEYFSRNVGISFGYLAGGLIFNYNVSLLFLGNAIGIVAMAALIMKYVPESRPSPEKINLSLKEGETQEKAELGGLVAAMYRRPILFLFSLVMIIYTFILGQNTFSLPLQINELFGRAGPPLFGSVMMVNGLTVVFMTALVTTLTIKNSSVVNVAIAGGLFALAYGPIGFYRVPALFYLSAVVWTLGEILMMTNARVFVADHTPMSHRGRFASIFPLLIGLGLAVGPLVMGRFIQVFGVDKVWGVLAMLGLLGAVLMTFLYRWERDGQKSRADLK